MATMEGLNIYWKRVAMRVKKFWERGDEIVEVEVIHEPNSKCQLCDYKPITEVHLLKNLRTSQTLRVGKCCAINYKVVIEKPVLFYHISKWGPMRVGVSMSNDGNDEDYGHYVDYEDHGDFCLGTPPLPGEVGDPFKEMDEEEEARQQLQKEIARQEAWERENAHLIEEGKEIAKSIWNLSQNNQEEDFIRSLGQMIAELLAADKTLKKGNQKFLRQLREEVEVMNEVMNSDIPF